MRFIINALCCTLSKRALAKITSKSAFDDGITVEKHITYNNMTFENIITLENYITRRYDLLYEKALILTTT